MTRKTLIAAVITAALPLAAYAGGDKASSGGASKSDGGAEAMFSSLDKNKDGKLSREEHAAAPEHAGKASAGSSQGEGSK